MKFFTSDTHFCDIGTIQTDGRPFKTAKAFDRYVIKLWNKQAKKGDVIYVVGDFVDCDNSESTTYLTSLNYVKKIKADVILIMGNNEDRVVKFFFDGDFEAFKKYCLSLGFKGVYKSLDIEVNDTPFHLVHKPIHCVKDKLNIFGHMHRAGGLYRSFGFNVNCDINHFYLYTEKDIKNMLYDKAKYWDVDANLSLFSLDS